MHSDILEICGRSLRFQGMRFLLLLPGLVLGLIRPAAAQGWEGGDYPRVHDPSTVVEDRDGVWCLGTGQGIHLLKREPDGCWRKVGPLFGEFPA